MTDTAKLKPEVSTRGVFFPWASVVTIASAFMLMVCVPLVGIWLDLRDFRNSSTSNTKRLDAVELRMTDNEKQDARDRERLATLEAKQ